MDYDTVTLLVTVWLWNAKLCLSCSGTNAVEFARGFHQVLWVAWKQWNKKNVNHALLKHDQRDQVVVTAKSNSTWQNEGLQLSSCIDIHIYYYSYVHVYIHKKLMKFFNMCQGKGTVWHLGNIVQQLWQRGCTKHHCCTHSPPPLVWLWSSIS